MVEKMTSLRPPLANIFLAKRVHFLTDSIIYIKSENAGDSMSNFSTK
jgi:hypothetical protein